MADHKPLATDERARPHLINVEVVFQEDSANGKKSEPIRRGGEELSGSLKIGCNCDCVLDIDIVFEGKDPSAHSVWTPNRKNPIGYTCRSEIGSAMYDVTYRHTNYMSCNAGHVRTWIVHNDSDPFATHARSVAQIKVSRVLFVHRITCHLVDRKK